MTVMNYSSIFFGGFLYSHDIPMWKKRQPAHEADSSSGKGLKELMEEYVGCRPGLEPQAMDSDGIV